MNTTNDTIGRTRDAEPADFSHVDTWVFDLDNTLYPRRTDLFSQIDARMTDYVAELLSVPRDEAKVVQKTFYRQYGTTLRGLMEVHRIDPDSFLSYVHNIDYSWLVPDPKLGEEIAALPGASSSSPTATGAMPSAPRANSASSSISRTCLTSSPPAWSPSPPPRPTTSSWASTASTRRAPPCSRTSPAISRCPSASACAPSSSCPRTSRRRSATPGSTRARRSPYRLRHRRPRRLPAPHPRGLNRFPAYGKPRRRSAPGSFLSLAPAHRRASAQEMVLTVVSVLQPRGPPTSLGLATVPVVVPAP